MDSWWLALDREHTSYDEVKARKVIAQGWAKLGDLSRFVPWAATPDAKSRFRKQIAELAKRFYGADSPEIRRAPKALWQFLQIQAGDLVVALEGTQVRGITQAASSAVDGYWFDPSYLYGQCVSPRCDMG